MPVTYVLYTINSIMDYYGENSAFCEKEEQCRLKNKKTRKKFAERRKTVKKKIVSFILVLVMVLGSVACVFAAEADPNVTIVNPVQDTPVTSSNLLISVKLTNQSPVVVNVLKESTTMQAITASDGTTAQEMVIVWDSVFTSEKFVPTSALSFYTKKLENVAIGNYIVRVDTLDQSENVIYETTRKVTVTEKEEAEEVFTKENTGVNNFLQSLLKSIFGN